MTKSKNQQNSSPDKLPTTNTMPKLVWGFTLVETVIVVAFFSSLSVGISTVILNIYKNYNQQSMSLSNADAARKMAFSFASELRNATAGNNGSFPLSQAGNSEITFYSSADLDGSIVKRIRYYLSGNTLYKGVITPTGNPLSYNSPEIIRSVQTNLANNGISAPVFYYFNGDYNGSGNPMAQPINFNQVKFVKMNLVISNPIGQSSGTFTVNAGATLRNLKTNLGN